MTTKATKKFNSWLDAFHEFQGNMNNIPKHGVNPYHNSKYVLYEDFVALGIPQLQNHGLTLVPTSRFVNDLWFVGSYLYHGESGTKSEPFEMLCQSGKMQEQGSSLTYAKRYTGLGVCGFGAEDDDGNATVMDHKSKPSAGYDPEDIEHAQALEKILHKKGIAADRWLAIGDKMKGKSFKDLDSIIGGN